MSNPLPKNVEMAFETQKSSVNLYTSLSTGIIAIGVAFIKDLLGGNINPESFIFLQIAAFLLIVCILLGVIVNHQIVGVLEQDPKASHKVDISTRAKNIGVFYGGQFICFFVAIILAIVFAFNSPAETNVYSNYLWKAESTGNLGDIGLYQSRDECILAIKETNNEYRCVLLKK